MVFATVSSPTYQLVSWVAKTVLALVFLLILQILAKRLVLIARRRRERQFLDLWQPLLAASLDSIPESFPAIRDRDAFTFLTLWNHLHESLLDQSKMALNEVARRLHIEDVASRMLHRGNLREQLLAVTTFGQLRQRSPWNELVGLGSAEHPVLSLTAAKALARIDPASAMPLILPWIVARRDWPAAKVAAMLNEAGADVFSEPLARALLEAEPEKMPRLIRYLELAHKQSAVPAIRRIILSTTNADVISACLRAFSDPEDLETVRAFVDHPAWHVRLQAAAALGRMGTEEDKPRLIRLLSDREWWVRYRAAQALANFHSIGPQELESIQAAEDDSFARDMLRQVIAERSRA